MLPLNVRMEGARVTRRNLRFDLTPSSERRDTRVRPRAAEMSENVRSRGLGFLLLSSSVFLYYSLFIIVLWIFRP